MWRNEFFDLTDYRVDTLELMAKNIEISLFQRVG